MFTLPANRNEIKANVFDKSCPARHLLSVISDKWSLLLIDILSDKSMRNGELMRAVNGISQKMLTQTLRNLETISLVQRHDMQTIPPHVEYSLTQKGASLRKIVCELDRWVENNMLDILPDEQVEYVD